MSLASRDKVWNERRKERGMKMIKNEGKGKENNVESLASDCYCFTSPLKFNTVLIWTLPSQFVTNSLSPFSVRCFSFSSPLISFVIFTSRRLEFWELHLSLSRTDHDTTDLIQWEQLFNGSSYFWTPTLSHSHFLSFPFFTLFLLFLTVINGTSIQWWMSSLVFGIEPV